jgi:hypothetical protein
MFNFIGETMLKNKDDFKSNEVVYKLLCGMEKAMAKKDAFAISVYLTKLKHHNITFEIFEEKNVKEDQPSQSQSDSDSQSLH